MRIETLTDDIGVVVIGRNEGERLVTCLRTINVAADRVVYVDSGSKDDSVATARGMGIAVVELDPRRPFTAARARNAGLAALIDTGRPPIGFVQFVDGDCDLAAGWIAAAVTFLRAHPEVAVVCGRRRERYPDRSVYNKLFDAEWNTPIGEATACGGDSMFRIDALGETEGFNPLLIAGEEPELCLRLRDLGHKVWRLDADMTTHDAAMLHFSQWWSRSRRSGYGFAQVAWLHRTSPLRIWWPETIRALVWGGLLPLIIIVSAVFRPEALLLTAIYPLQMIRSALAWGPRQPMSWIGAFYNVLGKFPECLGALKFIYQTWRNQQGGLIEYKQPTA